MPVSEYLARWSSREISEILAFRMLLQEDRENPDAPSEPAPEKPEPRELTPEEILALLDADQDNTIARA